MAASYEFEPLVTIVGFHHARQVAKGPELESWFGPEKGEDPAVENDWSLLPFMALSDGAHASAEEFSYFTLRQAAKGDRKATSLFGISCACQMDASLLFNRPADVTRSTVQKAVVVICDTPQFFGQLRERLAVVTNAWFAQRDFSDVDIIKFQESLAQPTTKQDIDQDEYLGNSLSLRELVHEFKHQTLVLFKCCLLQPKMLFFGSRCERLCLMQFSLISLIPGLIQQLGDCADPEFDNHRQTLVRATTLKTSDRKSVLSFMGLPLQIFGKGSLFGPYTPLQHLDLLADYGTKSYIVGSTNSLLLQQKDRYSDILINLDEDTISITSSSLRSALTLSPADRRWIDFIYVAVRDTWDEANPARPSHHGYAGSDEFIRIQFEEYLLALLSAAKYRVHYKKYKNEPSKLLLDVEGDPSNDFGEQWMDAWSNTENYKMFQDFTGSDLFDAVAPKHPCPGGITTEDLQRLLANQITELHLDERFNVGKEVLNKQLSSGQKKVTSAFNSVLASIEVMRENQRKKQEEQKAAGYTNGSDESSSNFPDMSTTQATVSAAGARAGNYISSWASWAGEKRKTGWGRSASSSAATTADTSSLSKTSSRPSTSSRKSEDFRELVEQGIVVRDLDKERTAEAEGKAPKSPVLEKGSKAEGAKDPGTV
ncbi:MAG: late secretory pathway protein avl9 [Vezdaea aestivalis]|nr:MAG: late secretory pathway protein avl9 [Vezdaea aestivalis]